MFTGIVESLSEATRLPTRTAPVLETVVGADVWPALALGESIAVNGVCLTVAELTSPDRVRFFLSPETLDRTALGRLPASAASIHLERAMPAQGRFSGHWVQGHVDGIGRWLGAEQAGCAYQARFALPRELLKYCVDKGSIAIDGVSLTINRVDSDASEVHVTLIPHTWEHTRFSRLAAGDSVNIEVDVLAKYVERMLGARPAGGAARGDLP